MTLFLHLNIRCNLACVALFTIVHLQMHIWSAADSPVCKTPECQQYASIYLKNLNKQGNPCTDFYDYVCRGWGTQYPRPPYLESWTVEDMLREQTFGVLRDVLGGSEGSSIERIQQARNIYRACMKLPYMEQSDSLIIKNIMAKIGNWPTFLPPTKSVPPSVAWWEIDIEYIKRTAESTLFDIDLVGDPAMHNRVTTRILRLQSPYGLLERTEARDFFGSQRKHYKEFLTKIITSVAPPSPTVVKQTIEKDLEDVIKFRDNLREMLVSVAPENFKTKTIHEVQQWYDKISQSHLKARINWLAVIRNLYKDNRDSYGAPITAATSIQIDKNYFVKLAALLGRTPSRVIINHIHIYFAERHVKLSTAMMIDIAKSYESNSDYGGGKIRHVYPRSRVCIERHSMQVTLRGMYINAVVAPNFRRHVNDLITEAKQVLEEEIAESPWLDKDTKAKALVSVERITSSIGYPDWINPSFPNATKDPLDIDPLLPEIYCVPTNGRLYVSASYLQPPLYSTNLPYVVEYGSTIASFGHELQHMFDQSVISIDLKSRQKWPNKMYAEHKKRAKCFESQYSKYRYAAMKKHKLNTWLTYTLPSTTDEDVADVTGLKAAYEGYRIKLKENKRVCPVLPGFEKMGCEKLFFIAFANTFCSASTTATEKVSLLTDNHSIPRIRVNGAVANMKEFSLAFGCKTNDPLNIRNRCNMWMD